MCFTKSSVRLTHVQGVGVSQPGTDSGCPSQRVSLKNFKSARPLRRSLAIKWPRWPCSNAPAFKLPRSSPIVHCAARGLSTCFARAGSDHSRERAALCQRRARLLLLP